MYKKRIIAVDFDGTIVQREDDLDSREFVLIPRAKEVIGWMYDNFFTILWTCREGQMLQNALDFLNRNNVKLHIVNDNAPFLSFRTSRKVFADYYIDDKARHIDWLKIKERIHRRFLASTNEIIVEKVLIEVKHDNIPK